MILKNIIYIYINLNMGIKHFFIWMKKNHPLCLKDINVDYEDFETEKIEIDNLCLI
jgi:hypothetical protein